MFRTYTSWWTGLLLAAGVAFFAGGCGGSNSAPDATEPTAEAETDAAAAPAEEVAAAPAPSEQPVAKSPQAKKSESPSKSEADSESTAQGETPAPSGAASATNAAATDELLSLALADSTARAGGDAAAAPGEGDASATPGAPGEDGSAASSDSAMQAAMRSAYGPPPGADTSANQGEAAQKAMMEAYARNRPSSSAPGAPTDSRSMEEAYGGMPPGSGAAGAAPAMIEPNYTDPVRGAETFLAAIATRNPDHVADSLALRSEFEAVAEHRPIFQKLLTRTAEESLYNQLAEIFTNMKVIGTNSVKSTGILGVIVGKVADNGDQITRVIEMRKEKAGWKVRDISNPRKISTPAYMRQPGGTTQPGQPGGFDSGSYDSSGGSSSESP